MITSCWKKSCRFEAGPASSGYSAPYYNMVYAMTYHDDEVGKKAQAELSTFMEKKTDTI